MRGPLLYYTAAPFILLHPELWFCGQFSSRATLHSQQLPLSCILWRVRGTQPLGQKCVSREMGHLWCYDTLALKNKGPVFINLGHRLNSVTAYHVPLFIIFLRKILLHFQPFFTALFPKKLGFYVENNSFALTLFLYVLQHSTDNFKYAGWVLHSV